MDQPASGAVCGQCRLNINDRAIKKLMHPIGNKGRLEAHGIENPGMRDCLP
jgi:hypothetical protein